MLLMTRSQMETLIKNFNANKPDGAIDHKPVIKLFGGGAMTWLLSEYDPGDSLFFGLCDLGMGSPELGYVSYEELKSVKFPPFGLGVERDRHFKATKTIGEYAVEAKNAGRIIA